jgi:hypothetical protein
MRPFAGAAPLTAVVAERDVVGRIGEDQAGTPAGQDPLQILGPRGISDQEAMLTQGPELAGLRPRSAGGVPQSRVEVEVLESLALLAGVEPAEQVANFIVPKPREAEVDTRAGLQVGQQTSQKPLVPGA